MLRQQLDSIRAAIEAAEVYLAEVEQRLAELTAAGMYPAVPSEQWQTRTASEGEYLYMTFTYDNNRGGYAGPEGKRKVYVGNKPEKIEEARRLASNRRRWEELNRHRRSLAGWLQQREGDLRALERESSRWKKVDLGQEAYQVLASACPKTKSKTKTEAKAE